MFNIGRMPFVLRELYNVFMKWHLTGSRNQMGTYHDTMSILGNDAQMGSDWY